LRKLNEYFMRRNPKGSSEILRLKTGTVLQVRLPEWAGSFHFKVVDDKDFVACGKVGTPVEPDQNMTKKVLRLVGISPRNQDGELRVSLP